MPKREKYGLSWNENFTDLHIEFWLLNHPTSPGFVSNKHHYTEAKRLIWPNLDEHRWATLCFDSMVENKTCVLLGCASCVSGDTEIQNPITGKCRTIKELFDTNQGPTVMTLFGPIKAGVPFLKGKKELLEITLENGNVFKSTADHLILTGSGFVRAESLQIGQSLFSYEQARPGSISEFDHEAQRRDALNSLRTTEDSEDCYSACSRPCDEPPRPQGVSDLSFSPSPNDAQAHTGYASVHSDGLDNTQGGIRLYQHGHRLSSADSSRREAMLETHGQSRACEENSSHVFPSSQSPSQSHSECSPQTPFSEQDHCWPHSDSRSNFASREQMWRSSGVMVSQTKVSAIRKLQAQDFYDLNVPFAHHYFANGAIHHNSGKTHTGAVWALLFYFKSPNDTCVIVSSTTMPSLKKRVWAEITMLWEQAVERHPWLPGYLLDSATAITTDNIEDFDNEDRRARSMRKGVFGVACVQGGKFVGLSRFMGIKQGNVLLLADEASSMASSFLSSVANLANTPNFRAAIMGNPNDLSDPLSRAAEPLGGWTDEYMEPKKTTVWKTRFMGGVCVNLVGQDSPNFDHPESEPVKYKYLINRNSIKDVLSFFPEDSEEFYSMCKGVMKIGTAAKRILSREMCEKGGALESAIWKDGNRTRIYFVDAAYGGDRCVAGHGEFGKDVNGGMLLEFSQPKIIPITVGSGREPEEIIADYIKNDCESLGIPPENVGHDSTGRGTLGTYIARAWSAKTNPIEAGGKPTSRPVNLDTYVDDPETRQKRLMRCDENYDRLVSEFHFALRHAVIAGQIRSLPEEAMEELIARKWTRHKEKYAVEVKNGTPTKPGFKQRFGKSPDVSDWACGIVEMARRKGFLISKLSKPDHSTLKKDSWLAKAAASARALDKSQTLQTF